MSRRDWPTELLSSSQFKLTTSPPWGVGEVGTFAKETQAIERPHAPRFMGQTLKLPRHNMTGSSCHVEGVNPTHPPTPDRNPCDVRMLVDTESKGRLGDELRSPPPFLPSQPKTR